MQNKTLPNKVFQKGPIKIGVFGIGIELDGLVNSDLYAETIYQDPIKIAQQQSDHLIHNMV